MLVIAVTTDTISISIKEGPDSHRAGWTRFNHATFPTACMCYSKRLCHVNSSTCALWHALHIEVDKSDWPTLQKRLWSHCTSHQELNGEYRRENNGRVQLHTQYIDFGMECLRWYSLHRGMVKSLIQILYSQNIGRNYIWRVAQKWTKCVIVRFNIVRFTCDRPLL